MSSLALTLLYLLAAVLGVVTCRSLKLPPMLGYLAAGVLIGPHAMALAQNSEGVRHLGEFGVVFLMFAIGLEFSLPKLLAMRKQVFGLGLMQVLLTMAVVTVGGVALSHWVGGIWDMGWQTALALSGVLAMSSTAIVVKLMAERAELESEHGRRVMGILLFQDLAVIPFLAAIAVFAADGGGESSNWIMPLAKVVAAIVGVIMVGRYLMRPIFRTIALSNSTEIFTATALLIVLGVALLMQYVGLSMALGAFLAGVLLADSEYRHQLEADIDPFRGILLGLFFLAVGMSIDFDLVLAQLTTILLAVALLIFVKIFTIWGVARLFGQSDYEAVKLGLTLSQGGEFAFVISVRPRRWVCWTPNWPAPWWRWQHCRWYVHPSCWRSLIVTRFR